jgi:hypothetical protein
MKPSDTLPSTSATDIDLTTAKRLLVGWLVACLLVCLVSWLVGNNGILGVMDNVYDTCVCCYYGCMAMM